jgi:hypothetical protein
MEQRRRAEYEKYRDEIAAWSEESSKALKEAVASGDLPSFTVPPSTNGTYKRVLRMIEEDSTGAFNIPPVRDLTVVSAIEVIEAINLVLSAHGE